MASRPDQQAEVDRNFRLFQKRLPELLETHAGEFALLRKGEIISFFESAKDAKIYGDRHFEDGLFSIQLVTDRMADLGYFSHAESNN